MGQSLEVICIAPSRNVGNFSRRLGQKSTPNFGLLPSPPNL